MLGTPTRRAYDFPDSRLRPCCSTAPAWHPDFAQLRSKIGCTSAEKLIAYLEQTYGIKVHEDEMISDNLDSLNGVGRYLQRKLSGARA